MSGKFYNGALYVHKVMYEALQRLRFESFMNSLKPEERNSIEWFAKEHQQECLSTELLEHTISSFTFERIYAMYEEFIKINRLKNATFDYWCSYIDMVGKKFFHFFH